MRLRPAALLVVALVAWGLDPAEAYRRLKVGPLEFVPSLGVEVRHHSNVYVSNEERNQAAETEDDRVDPTADVSGIIVDVRPGLDIIFRPKIEKKIRGFYFDFRYSPSIALFPDAPTICEVGGSDEQFRCAAGQNDKPDQFKIDHNARAAARYQTSPRLTIFADADYGHPELSRAEASLDDLSAHAGAKYDFSRVMSMEGAFGYERFISPSERVIGRSSTDPGVLIQLDSPLGSYEQNSAQASLRWQWRPTLNLGATYQWRDREFVGFTEEFSPDPLRNDFNNDGVPDQSKDYVEHIVRGTAVKRLTSQATGSISGGYTWRSANDRQFGEQTYSRWNASGSAETLLSKRTRLQFSASYGLSDTFLRIPFPDLNAFTNDALGQFAVLPEQFSTGRSQRYILDLIQNVFRRGDQVLLGLAYQMDELVDQQGAQNFFDPFSTPRGLRRTDASSCEEPGTPTPEDPFHGARFCGTSLPDLEQNQWIVSAGYRVRLYRWLGLQVRGAYYNGESTIQPKSVTPDFIPPEPEPVETNYWSVGAGVVINLQVFQ